MSYSFVKNSANDQTPEETQLIIFYELGSIFDCCEHGNDKAYRAFCLGEVADLISMTRMLCEQKDWSFTALMNTPAVSTTCSCIQDALHHMLSNLCKVDQRLHYVKRFGKPIHGDPVEAMVLFIHSIIYFCFFYGFDFNELITLGEERYEEAMENLRQRGKK